MLINQEKEEVILEADESSKSDLEKSDIDSNALYRMLKDSAKIKSNVKSFNE